MLTEPGPPLFTEEKRLIFGSVVVWPLCWEIFLTPIGVGTPPVPFWTSLTFRRPSRETDFDCWPVLDDPPAT